MTAPVIAAQSGVAGSTKVGKYCVIGAQVGIVGHISVADGNIIAGQSGISGTIKDENKKWFGTPVLELRDALRSGAITRRLPELLSRIEAIEKELLMNKKA
jgi:UDP-3-O-[3-hydroxymyristoyl] glucosamine N-acyltransferase